MQSPPHASLFKRLARRVARPVMWRIDSRVADIKRHVGTQGEVLRGLIAQLEATVSAGIGSYARASTEATSYVGLELRKLAEATHDLDETVREVSTATLEEYYRDRLVRARDAPLEQLDAELASLLNHAAGHRGFVAQAELWFNPPVTVELSAGRARLTVVNERIVEVPFAMEALARVAPPARILDIGSAESTFPLSAASLGYQVTAIDPRPLPYSHPNLDSVARRFEDWQGPSGSFAAAFLISTIEHVGLPAYGVSAYSDADPGTGADVAMLTRLSELLTRDGLLVLTTPYGRRGADDFQRTYDDESLSALLADWNILERRIVTRRDDLVWVADGEGEPAGAGVVMIVASPARA